MFSETCNLDPFFLKERNWNFVPRFAARVVCLAHVLARKRAIPVKTFPLHHHRHHSPLTTTSTTTTTPTTGSMPLPQLDPALEAQVQHVHTITLQPPNLIRSDLRFTGSAEQTIARVLDGSFLRGTERDPQRPAAGRSRGSATAAVDAIDRPPPPPSSVPPEVIAISSDDDAPAPAPTDAAASPKKPSSNSKRPRTDESNWIMPNAPNTPNKRAKTRQSVPVDMGNVEVLDLSQPSEPPPCKSPLPAATPPAAAQAPLDLPSIASELAFSPIIIPDDNGDDSGYGGFAAGGEPRAGSDAASGPDRGARGAGGRSPRPGAAALEVGPGSPAPRPARPNLRRATAASPTRSNPHPLWETDLSSNDESDIGPVGQSYGISPGATPGISETSPGKGKQSACDALANARFSAATWRLISSDHSDDHGDPRTGHKRTGKRKAPTGSKSTPTTTTTTTAATASTGNGRRGRLSEQEKARRAAESAAKAEAREARKAAKEAAAAAKAAERELAAVNKLRIDRTESVREMIVDLSPALVEADGGLLGQRLLGLLGDAGCEACPGWLPPASLGPDANSWRLVTWRRRVRADYNAERGLFVPLDEPQVRAEQQVLVHLTAAEFVAIACPQAAPAASSSSGRPSLDRHVATLKRLGAAAGVRPIYLIEGLAAYYRQARVSENRQFRSQVHSAMSGSSATTAATATATATAGKRATEDRIEDALLKLQVKHNCLIQQTATAEQSAEWIAIFTADISHVPYKSGRHTWGDGNDADDVARFTVEAKRTGVDRADTWRKMLLEIHRVTPPVAEGIAARYEHVRDLVAAFRSHGGGDGAGDAMLQTLPQGANVNGSVTTRTVGAALSRRVAAVFLGRDASVQL